jgi:N-acyl-D-amino-acid deacylase
MRSITSWALLCAATVLSGSAAPAQAPAQRFDLIIADGRVMDGTGNPWFPADVGIREGRIAAVGDLAGATATRTVDASGKLVLPGFIDLHSHAGDEGRERNGLTSEDPRRRAAPNLVMQGATTLVVNQDGRSPWPIGDQRARMQQLGIGPNAILLVGHGAVRSEVMGDDFQRSATDEEVRRMRALVRQAMEEGALGLSAGHEYVPMRWSTTEEVVGLVSEVAPYRGVYVVHERASGTDPMWWLPSEGPPAPPSMLDAVMETIEVAERTGVTSVQTHIKARGAHFWGAGHAMIQMIERARARGIDIWADSYPYNTTGSDGATVLVPGWALDSDRWGVRGESYTAGAPRDYTGNLRRVLDDPAAAARLRSDVAHEIRRRGDPENIMVFEHPDQSYIGKTLHQISRAEGISPVEAAIKLQLDGFSDRPGGARLRSFSLSEIDVEAFAGQPWMVTASDAGVSLPEDGPDVHPRYYGTFPRKIRRYALERGVLSVEDAVRSMTSLPAQVLGLRDRGQLREGFVADVVVLDLEKVRDRATFFEPHQYPEGIEHVLVKGEFVVESGRLTGALPGEVITADDRGPAR